MTMLAQAQVQTQTQMQKQTATLLSDIGGEITEFAVETREDWFGPSNKRAAAAKLITSLAANGAKVVVVAREHNASDVDAWMKGLKCSYALVRVPNSELASDHIWARDTMLIATDNGGALRLLRPCVINKGDWHKWLAQHVVGASPHGVGVCMEGGDSIKAGNDLWLVGATAIKFTMKTWNCTWDQAVARIAAEVGNGMSPTIAGYRLSGLSFSNQLRWLIEQRRQHKQEFGRAETFSKHFFGRLAAGGVALTSALRDAAKPLKQHWAHIDLVVSVTGRLDGTKPVVLVADTCPAGCKPNTDAHYQGEKLNSLAQVLTEAGCKVIRNPAPYVDSRILPYSNTIIQTKPQRVVWLPVFGGIHQATDDANIAIWRDTLKFDRVIPVSGWDAFIKVDGSVRCWTLPLRRVP